MTEGAEELFRSLPEQADKLSGSPSTWRGLRTCAKPSLRRCRARRGATNQLLPTGCALPPAPGKSGPEPDLGLSAETQAAVWPQGRAVNYRRQPCTKGPEREGKQRGHKAAVPARPRTQGESTGTVSFIDCDRTHFLSFPNNKPPSDTPCEDSTSPTDRLSQGVKLPLAGAG